MQSLCMFDKKCFFMILMVLFLLLFSIRIAAQDTEENKPLYIITEVSCSVDGSTQENLLINYMEIKIGEQFLSLTDLQDYLLDKQVYLNNNRIFAEGTVSIGSIKKQNDKPNQVYVEVWAKDTWNIIALPYFKFDSNDGLLLSLRGRNYNFLGSMERLAFNLDYRYTEDSKHLISLNGEFSLPFVAWDRDWVFDIEYDTEYEDSYPLYFNLDTDLGYFFTLFDERWRFNISNEYSLNDRDSDPEPEEEAIPDKYYLTSGLSVGGPVATGVSVGRHDITWNPKLSTSVSYIPLGLISKDRRGVSGTFSHSLKLGRIDWKGNFRKGYKVSLSNSNSYSFHTGVLTPIAEFNTQFFTTWGWGGLNSRLKGFYRFTGDSDNVGGSLRGILDNRIDNVETGVYLNVDFPFNMWIWFMSRWFEGHLSPFVDFAMFRYADGSSQSDPFWYSGGIEAFAFPKSARSFYLRISAGMDLAAFLKDDEILLEYFIGLGHHY